MTLAVDQSPASILITDADGRIEYVNEKFTEITGYSAEEAIGQTTRILQSGNTPAEVYQSLWENVRAGKPWEGEIQNRCKDGELYWDYVQISPIRDEDGRVEHYLSVQEDITARKRTEEALRRSVELFDQFAEHVKEAFFLMEVPNQSARSARSTAGWGRPRRERKDGRMNILLCWTTASACPTGAPPGSTSSASSACANAVVLPGGELELVDCDPNGLEVRVRVSYDVLDASGRQG